MRIPRFQLNTSTVSELQAARASIMSPGEAARLETIKFGAITDVAGAIGDAALAYDKAVTEEDLNAAKSQWISAMGQADTLVNETSMYNEDGTLAYDPLELPKLEAEARKKIESNIRGEIRSERGRREFNAWAGLQGAQRDVDYAELSLKKNNEFMLDRGEQQVSELMLAQQYTGAEERVLDLLGVGVYDRSAATAKMNEIALARDDNLVYDALNNNLPNDDLIEIKDQLLDGKHADGTNMRRTEKERYALRNQIQSHMDARVGNRTEAVKARQRTTYVAMFEAIHDPEIKVTPSQVLAAFEAGDLDATMRGELMGFVRDTSTGLDQDDPNAKHEAQDLYNQVMDGRFTGKTYEEAIEGYILSLGALELSSTTRAQYAAKARNDLDAIYSNPEVQDLEQAGFNSLMGIIPGVTTPMQLTEGYNPQLERAYQFQREIRDKALELGPAAIRDGELEEWYEGKLPLVKLEAKQEEMAEIGITVEFDDELMPKDHEAAQAQLVEWWLAHPNHAEAQSLLRKHLDAIKAAGLNIYRTKAMQTPVTPNDQ
jgi:hypothetical protein